MKRLAVGLALLLAACEACEPRGPRITPERLPDGEVGKPYRAEVGALRSPGPIEVIGVGSGTLPPGLALRFTNGDAHGVIEGTPTSAGRSSFQLGVWFQGSKSVGPRVVGDYSISIR
jgi:hypothetical protein